jgi:hypothetical protein
MVEEHLSRLAWQHALAIAYEADGQVGKAVELLEHVVVVRAKVLVECDGGRCRPNSVVGHS